MAAEAAEYRETLAIEKAIAEKPDLREAWINRQLQLDLTDNMIEDESEEEVNA